MGGYKTRIAKDDLGSADMKGDTLRKQLRQAKRIRDATPKAWSRLSDVLARSDNEPLARQHGVAPEDVICAGMVQFVAFGIVTEKEVETLYSNLSALYHRPDFYMGRGCASRGTPQHVVALEDTRN